MTPPARPPVNLVNVRGTELLAGDGREQYRQKLARITLDSMVQFVGLLDAQGTVLEINQVALDAVGITLADVEGRPFWTTFWWQVSEANRAVLRESIARAARGEFVRWDAEIYGRAGGKETIVIDASLCPVKDERGEVVFITAEGRDITEKKAHEREIAQKNIELQGLLERIRELDEIKTQFFANVSHELRTPLALILGPAQRLLDDEGAAGPGPRREAARVVVRNARMLLKHVNDLLDMSKIEAGRLKIEPRDVDVAAMLRFVASHFGVLAAERGVDYAVDAGGPCVAAVDPDKLQRVLMNLLANAFKFVPDGGRVRCSVGRSARGLTIAVDDSGPGVKPGLRLAVFERFRQGEGGSSRKAGGTGLGLAIAKEFVEMHKGRIEALDSDLGGARFQITLPSLCVDPGPGERAAPADLSLDRSTLDGLLEELRPPAPAGRAGGAAAPGAAGRPIVLVVEDNPDMNRFVGECLARDYDVVSAFDGREGLEKALRYRPALAVSDVMMPGMSGDEMIAEMRRQPELSSMPILLLSAKADEELMTRLLDEGAQDFIVKPFAEKDLLVRARNLVATHQARQEIARSLGREQRAREEAELQKRLLYSVFMQAPLFIAVLRGPDHVVELANPLMCQQIWQRPEAELLNRPLFEAMPGLGDQGARALLGRVYRTGEPYVGRETPVKFERGGGAVETLYFNFIYSALRNVEGAIEGIFVVASDVTAQALARQQVEGLREAAEGANRAKDEFLAMLGHELRNPLSPILTALQLMRQQGPEVAERARVVVERQVNHLTRLVDDLLDVSRIARGRVELKKEVVELADVVAKGVEISSPLLEQRAHELAVDVPARGLPVDGDPTRLGQVVSNLLTNAAKYTPPGGRVAVRARRDGDEAVLSVRDSGVGIAPDVLPRVFDLFVQSRRSIDRSEGGLGLGLAIVRSLVEGHGGAVSAHSEGPGKGSEFVVRLPLAAGPRRPEGRHDEAAGAAVAGPRAGGPRILVVDDNEDGATMLALALTRRGYDTRVANDAATALEIAAEFRPDVAFLDIGLPVMDGYELASHLRAIAGLEGLRLVALTGYGQESDRRRSREAGFQHHLVKPVALDALEDVIRAC